MSDLASTVHEYAIDNGLTDDEARSKLAALSAAMVTSNNEGDKLLCRIFEIGAMWFADTSQVDIATHQRALTLVRNLPVPTAPPQPAMAKVIAMGGRRTG